MRREVELDKKGALLFDWLERDEEGEKNKIGQRRIKGRGK